MLTWVPTLQTRRIAALPVQAAKARLAKPTPHPAVPANRAPVLNMYVRRATLTHAPHRASTGAVLIAATITEAVHLIVVTTEVAHPQEALLRVQAAVQAAAIAAEATAQVQVATAQVVEVAAVQAVAVAVALEAEEDNFRPIKYT